ncbi:helix-turn-helix domain-containing protein [Streptomyces antibioticus]|uniref:helix-turn-helix domain-containing protein n=1 Tax=Streptomyces antibioticus TaxID=1890 RepID=UPI0033F6C346
MQHLPHADDWITRERRHIGDTVRGERIRQNLTQDAVWLAAGISRGTLQRAEAGEDVTLSTLLRILRVLGMPFAALDH